MYLPLRPNGACPLSASWHLTYETQVPFSAKVTVKWGLFFQVSTRVNVLARNQAPPRPYGSLVRPRCYDTYKRSLLRLDRDESPLCSTRLSAGMCGSTLRVPRPITDEATLLHCGHRTPLCTDKLSSSPNFSFHSLPLIPFPPLFPKENLICE